MVDHVRRREELADSVLTIVARDGITGVTMRTVAKESGWSSGVLSHYFNSRHELLLAALRRAAHLQGGQFKLRRQENAADPVKQLEVLIEDILPLDERRVALTRIFLFFYAEAAQDEATREEIADYLSNWRRVVARAVQSAQEAGSVPSDVNPDLLAVQLVAYADGLSMHAVLDAEVLQRIQHDPQARSMLDLAIGAQIHQ